MTAVVGEAVLFGGVYGGTFRGDTWTWDGVAWTERAPAHSPPARYEHVMTTQGDRAILFGGSSKLSYLRDTWQWDGTDWTDLAPATSPAPRASPGMATLGGKAILFGGIDGAMFDDTWEWDGAAWSLRVPTMNAIPRSAHAMAQLPDRVLIFGGIETWLRDDSWEWDGGAWTDRTSTSAQKPLARDGHAMAALGSKAVMFGGAGIESHGTEQIFGFLDDTWEWDAGTWTRKSPSVHPSRRIGAAMVTLGDSVLLFGGNAGAGGDGDAFDALGDTWRWDGAMWTKLQPRTSPPARYHHAMAALTGKIVLFGGYDGQSSLNDTWEWDGATWTKRTPLQSPPPRQTRALVAVRGTLVMFGGYFPGSGSLTNISFFDTWSWDGNAWLNLNATPTPRSEGEPMAYFGGKLVLFGGAGTWFGSVGSAVGSACARSSDCASGFCVDGVCCDTGCGGGSPVDCQACSVVAGAAHDGTCRALRDNTACSDDDACTQQESCLHGSCVAAKVSNCPAIDACHPAGECLPSTGACSTTAAPDGTWCGAGKACANGACVQVAPDAGTGARVDTGAGDVAHPAGHLASRGCACDAGRGTADPGRTAALLALVMLFAFTRRIRKPR